MIYKAVSFQGTFEKLSLDSNLGHHASPSDKVGINLLASLLFMGDDGLEQAVEVFITTIILLLKGVETL